MLLMLLLLLESSFLHEGEEGAATNVVEYAKESSESTILRSVSGLGTHL
jgi:hypothetical protein